MPIALPNLDDRRWVDLVEEARALIPLYAPDWTDHNVHDPGISLIELLAWVAEMDIYQLNQVPDRHLLKFLALAGIRPRPPQASHCVLALSVNQGGPADLPWGVQYRARSAPGESIVFTAQHPLTVQPGALHSLQLRDPEGRFRDVTENWRRGEPVAPFGEDPREGSELYLGFSQGFESGRQLSLYLACEPAGSDGEQRRRLIEEALKSMRRCLPPASRIECRDQPCGEGKPLAGPHPDAETDQDLPPHHCVSTAWSFSGGGPDGWVELGSGEISDDTRSLTLDGRVVIRFPQSTQAIAPGRQERPLHYLRCRLLEGRYDAAPRLRTVSMNAVLTRQAEAAQEEFPLAKGATVEGPLPAKGEMAAMTFSLNAERKLTWLRFEPEGSSAPRFRILDLQLPSAGQGGRMILEAALVGIADGKPFLELNVHRPPLVESELRLYTLQDKSWQAWTRRDDFDRSGPADAHFVLDASSGMIRFGDGQRGIVPPRGAMILGALERTRASSGKVRAGTVTSLPESERNLALLDDLAALQGRLAVINPLPAWRGADRESLAHASGRAVESLSKSHRAVTARDYQRLALETPGTRLASAKTWPNMHPRFACYQAPGLVTVVVVPFLPDLRPQPCAGLLRAVRAYLNSRRLLGSRIEVVAPSYLEVGVRARVQPCQGASPSSLIKAVSQALEAFLHPLRGGPDGSGWPFGRDVYRSEILQVIDEVEGVEHVLSLQLLPAGKPPQCGNVCLRPTWLTTPGLMQIEIPGERCRAR